MGGLRSGFRLGSQPARQASTKAFSRQRQSRFEPWSRSHLGSSTLGHPSGWPFTFLKLGIGSGVTVSGSLRFPKTSALPRQEATKVNIRYVMRLSAHTGELAGAVSCMGRGFAAGLVF